MRAILPHFLLIGIFAASVLLIADTWNTSVHAQEETEDPVTCVGTLDQPGLTDEQITQLKAIVSPRGNVSHHNNGIFIEWNLVHNRYVLEQDLSIGDGAARRDAQWANVFPDGQDDEIGSGTPPTHFWLERSNDGGTNWQPLIRVDNPSDRYDSPEDAWMLDVVWFLGRQLTYRDTDIVWPPRYPGHTYHYRVVVVYNDACGVPIELDEPILVQDPVPTTCAQVPDFDEAALEALFAPSSSLGEKGYTVSWTHVGKRNSPTGFAFNNEIFNNLAEHAAAAPIADTIPHFQIQRHAGDATALEDPYFANIKSWANDDWGRTSEWVDTNIAPSTTYTYRLVAVYGDDCGIPFEMDPVEPTLITCDNTAVDFDSRGLRRLLVPRRSFSAFTGVLATWYDIPAGDQHNEASPFVGGALPTTIALQRLSVPTEEFGNAGDYGDDQYVTLASFANDGAGVKVKYRDTTAKPGYTHLYRMVVVYNDTCGVVTRPMSPVRMQSTATLIRENPDPAEVGTVIRYRQVYWASIYALQRSTTGSNGYETIDYISHKNGNPFRSYIDPDVRLVAAPEGAQREICYRLLVRGQGSGEFIDVNPDGTHCVNARLVIENN